MLCILQCLGLTRAGDTDDTLSGDSFSAIGYKASHSPAPSPTRPLGVEFPGETFCEAENWVPTSTFSLSFFPSLRFRFRWGV